MSHLAIYKFLQPKVGGRKTPRADVAYCADRKQEEAGYESSSSPLESNRRNAHRVAGQIDASRGKLDLPFA
jgi:hypothetical protein